MLNFTVKSAANANTDPHATAYIWNHFSKKNGFILNTEPHCSISRKANKKNTERNERVTHNNVSFILNSNEYKYVCGVCVFIVQQNDIEWDGPRRDICVWSEENCTRLNEITSAILKENVKQPLKEMTRQK